MAMAMVLEEFCQLWSSASASLSNYDPIILVLLSALLGSILPLLLSALHSTHSLIHEKGVQPVLFSFLFQALRKIPGIRGYIQSEQNKVIDKMISGTKSQRSSWISELPRKGLGSKGALERLQEEKLRDKSWQGKCSGTVYIGGAQAEEHFSLLNDAYALFAHTNPLHSDVFPSVAKLEAEVVAMTASLLGSKDSNDEVCGNMTSGGTESILMAVKSTRDYMNATRGISSPEMIIPLSAHSAYNKAAQYFRIKLRVAPVNEQLQVDLKGVKRLINKNTIMIVGSAPGFPHGVMDPIKELGALAKNRGICFHVDLCLGGFVLPFARKLGYPVPAFDFSVAGVTSISIDVHKFGLAPKGTSVVLYRNHQIRRHQFVAVTDWSGGLYISPSMAGSRSGALIAGAWAALVSLGEEGYLKMTKTLFEASQKMINGIREIPGLFILGEPVMTVIALGSNEFDIYKVNDIMTSKGWSFNALQKPPSIHFCVTLQHSLDVIEELLEDLRAAAKEVKENESSVEGGMAPIYGAAGKMPDRGAIEDILIAYMDSCC